MKDYACEFYGKKFSQQSNVQTHILAVYEKIRFNCDICGKSFITKGERGVFSTQQVHRRSKVGHNLSSINQMTFQSIAITEMRKSIHHNTLPQIFSSICKSYTPVRRTHSHSQSIFHPLKWLLSSTMSSFSSKPTSVWNKLPIRDLNLSDSSFKKYLKNWLKNSNIP